MSDLAQYSGYFATCLLIDKNLNSCRIRDKVLNTNTVNADVKNLIKLAVGVAAENESCAVFNCNYIKKV